MDKLSAKSNHMARELLGICVRHSIFGASLLLGSVAFAAAEIQIAEDGAGGLVLSNPPAADAVAADLGGGARRIDGSGAVFRKGAAQQARDLVAPAVELAAKRHDLPEALLNAVIQVESNFNPRAVSPKGATGLMQLMPATARQLGVRDAREAAANVDGGARYLKELLTLFGNDLNAALAAYNAGPAAVVRSGGRIPPFAETRAYVPKVIGLYHGFQSGSYFTQR